MGVLSMTKLKCLEDNKIYEVSTQFNWFCKSEGDIIYFDGMRFEILEINSLN